MADGAKEEEDLYAGPLCDRVESANWKVRKAAYEELIKKFKESFDNAIFDEYASAFKKIVVDKNAAAQEKGLEALLVWIDRAEDPTSLNSLAGSIIEKCFGGRPNTKTKAVEALVLFVEVDKNAEAIVTALIEGATNKQWKIAQLSIATIAQILKTFGAKVIPMKLLLKNLAKFFEDSNKAVRDEAQTLAIELYRWIGEAIKPSIDGLRPAQVKELEEAFAKLPKVKATPAKYLRCEQPQDDEEVPEAKASSGQSGGGDEEEGEEEKGFDAYDLAEPVDILSKIGDDWFTKLASPKWKERLEQMDSLINMLNTPRLKPGDYREVAKTLKTVITKDANVAVVTKAVQAAGMLTKGLRQEFSAEAKSLVPALLGKFKEKKASVVVAINETLDLMTNTCFTVADIVEDFKEAVADKVPQVRENSLVFVTRFITMKNSQRGIVGTVIPALTPLFLQAMDDAIPGVREAAYKAFGQLCGKVGERAMSPFLSKLDGIKEKRVKENFPEKMFTGTLVLPGAKPPGASNASKPGQKVAPKKGASAPAMKKSGAASGAKKPAPQSAQSKETAKRSVSTATIAKPEEPAAKPAPARKPSTGAAVAPVQEKKPAPPKMKKIMVAKKILQEVPPPQPVTPEEALEKASSLFASTILEGLSDSVWKNRLAAMTELIGTVEPLLETHSDDPSFVDILMRLLEQKPGFKDSNIQVMGKIFELVTKLSSSPYFDARLADLLLEELVTKIGDIKLRIPALACLNALSEAVGVGHVISQVCKFGEASKNPKVANETLAWLTSAIEEFGFQDTNIDVKILVDYMKNSLESSNAMVRSSAVKGFGKMFVYLGDSIKEHLTEVKPALMSTIDKEFEKWANAKPSPPTRAVRNSTPTPRTIEVEVMEEIEVIDEEATAAAAAETATTSRPKSTATAPAPKPAVAAEPIFEELEEKPATPQEIVREDISAKLTTALLADLSNNDWKVKKDALDRIYQILKTANFCVQPNGIPVLMSKLKDRLQDSNKNLVAYTLKLLGPVATSVGPHIDRYSKHILPLVLANYTDQKNTVRDITTATLDAWVVQSGVDSFIPYLPKAIAVDNSAARKEVLAWLVKHQSGFTKNADVKVLIKPVITCLQDRTPEVRHQAELVLADLLARTGLETVKMHCNDLKQAAKMQVVGVLKKLLEQQRAQQKPAEPAPQIKQPQPVKAVSVPSSTTTSPQAKNSLLSRSEDKVKVRSPATTTSTVRKTPNQSRSSSPAPSLATVSTRARDSGASSALEDERRSQKAQPPLIANEDKELRAETDMNIGADNAVGKGWAFKGAPSPAHVQHLAEQMKGCVNAELHAKLFSKDFRKHREALTELAVHVETFKELETKQNLDVLLKYATLRLYDANDSTLKKTVEFLRSLFDVLDSIDYHLTHYEAGIIVPILLDLTAQGENLAATSTELLRSFPRIYPASKLFDWYTGLGLEAKSPRTKVETLTLCSELLRRQGLTVCSKPADALPRFAAYITSSVAGIRNASLTALQQAYLHIGEDLWMYLPDLSETQKALLNQKLNGESPAKPVQAPARPSTPKVQEKPLTSPRPSMSPMKIQSMPVMAGTSTPSKNTPTKKPTTPSSAKPSTKPAAKPTHSKTTSTSSNASSQSSEEKATKPSKPPTGGFTLELDKLEVPDLPKKSILKKPTQPAPAKVEIPSIAGPTPSLPTRHRTMSASKSSSAASLVPEDATSSPLFSYIITWTSDISSGDPAIIIKACTDIQEKIETLGEGPFVGTIDGLLGVLIEQLRVSFTSKDYSVRKNKECKYLINVLLKIFQRPKVAVVITRPITSQLYGVMFEAFAVIDAKMAKIQKSPSDTPPSDSALTGISKGLGILIKAMLKNTDMTASFGTLFESLDSCLTDKELSKRIGGVVVKSLLVIFRYLQESGEGMDLEQLFYDLYVLLDRHQAVYLAYVSKNKAKSTESTPVDENGTGTPAKLTDEAMKFLKNLISHLVKVNGRGVSQFLGKVPADKYPTPLLVRIINQTLKRMFEQSGQAAEEDQENAAPPSSNSMIDATETRLDAKAELVNIFRALQTKKGAEQHSAMKALDRFKKTHPEIDVSMYLNTASPQFQAYITRGMMAFNDKENAPNQSQTPEAGDAGDATMSSSDSSFMEKLRALQKKYGVSNAKTAVPPAQAAAANGKSVLSASLPTIPTLNTSRVRAASQKEPPMVVSAKPTELAEQGGSDLASLQKRIKSMGVQQQQQNENTINFALEITPEVNENSSTPATTTTSSSSSSLSSSGGASSIENLKARLAMIKQNSSAN